MSIKPQPCLKSKYGDKKYPVMKIKDIEVHCIHDKDVKESIEKWERRKKRMFSLSKCYIKMCDHDRYEDEYGKRFIKLRFKKKKLFLSKKNYFGDKCVIKTKYKNRCPDGYALGKDYPIQRYLLKGQKFDNEYIWIIIIIKKENKKVQQSTPILNHPSLQPKTEDGISADEAHRSAVNLNPGSH